MMNIRKWLQQEVESWGISLSDQQVNQFHQYYEMLIEWNKVMNLTGITEEKEVYIKHFYDSLTLAKVIPVYSLQSMIDVGTGAGFPGIPLKIAFPHLKVVLLDSLKKRVGFLQEVCHHLSLVDVECIHGRAEELAHKKEFRQSFDLATARAVAKLNTLSEYCLPFVKVGGTFVAMKGAEVAEEMIEAKNALHKLGKVSLEKTKFSLPEEMGERHLLVMKKRDNTPRQYPRKAGMPTKQPIQ